MTGLLHIGIAFYNRLPNKSVGLMGDYALVKYCNKYILITSKVAIRLCHGRFENLRIQELSAGRKVGAGQNR